VEISLSNLNRVVIESRMSGSASSCQCYG